ncbi:MAG: hypothetical protein KZQ94_17455 [Candidatus Thiodiazotropha sp. (ex Troendleina suluensis)]|nr:hypothetical protein [Candidatus Thiodiazotropha sp. (ex Troendleina suluensis)]MCU7854950.1 hypothetical protein [Candidatus Thiodiazotropha sp. (ex Lucinoma borealis)]
MAATNDHCPRRSEEVGKLPGTQAISDRALQEWQTGHERDARQDQGVVNVINFLLGDESSWVTGAI